MTQALANAATSRLAVRELDRVVDLADEWAELEERAHADELEAGRWLLLRRASRDASEAVAILGGRVDDAEATLGRAIDDAIAARAELADACAFAARVVMRLARVDRAAVARALGVGR